MRLMEMSRFYYVDSTEIHVADCELCDHELYIGDDAIADTEEPGIYFCSEECYSDFHKEHMKEVSLERELFN